MGMSEILDTGAEVELEHRDSVRVYDRVRITGRVIICINKSSYQKDVWPLGRVEAIHTHTSDEEENAGWW
jgi:hypothetical protein